MKKFLDFTLYLFFTIFIIGFCLKFFRFPMHTIIMLVGIGGTFITSILYIIFKQKESGFISLCICITAGLLITIVKFLPTTYLLITTLIFLLGVITIYYKTKKIYLSHHLILVSILVITMIIGTIPSDKRYYLFNIQSNHHIETDYWAWDKYSWHLNKNGNTQEASIAIQKAYEIVRNTNDQTMKDLITNHKTQLEQDNWRNFK